jgi:uroporphyrinogen decarboxylase
LGKLIYREKEMNSREKVVRAIQFQKPDYLPVSHAILPSAQYRYGKKLSEIINSFHEDFGWHLLPDLPAEKLPPLYKPGKNYDDWGTGWFVTVRGRCGIPIDYPIKPDLSDYDNYRWPEVFGAGVPKYRLYSGHMSGKSDAYYARGGWIVFFEQMQQLVGFDNLLVALTVEIPEVYRLRDDLLKFNLEWIDNWLKSDYQGLHFADDWGSQTNLLIPPDLWRSFFKPVYKEMFSRVKSRGLHVWYHSDGNILEIIPDLIELGVDVLNCQASVMDMNELKKFAGKLAFRTDIDRQKILPFVSPGEVKDYIFYLFHQLGTADGGIIACGEISEDVPLENIKAMYEAFIEFRW